MNALVMGFFLGVAISASPDLPNLYILESGLSYSRKEAVKMALATLVTDNLIFLCLSALSFGFNLEWNPGAIFKQFSGLFLIVMGLASTVKARPFGFHTGGCWLGVIGSLLNPLGYFPILLFMSSLPEVDQKIAAYLGALLGTALWFAFLILFLYFLSRKLRLMTRQSLSRALSVVIILVGVFFVLSGSC
ncbi:hypothetical protein GTO89_04110 [Heliobacterium gestii]|uniref:Lysine transporter LysE n=1 Tax=Heliomicrobium gestii TaxID=2699 RepID=A0A845LFC8_HELGE|nr:hypothetical protein [Heliomicrobium gestii]MBM7866794.1 threonine/homoserine/homoserine lactone efflux protein [Heliomicrobium gestii]MZP42223.1 hypothetical protein [Heliomicrobium gestii]